MAAPPSPSHAPPPMLLAMDTQGLRTDRLLHVRVFAEEEGAEGQAKGASVVVTKGRFSEDKRRFMERSETFALRANSPIQGNVKVLALGQVLDDTTGRLCTCFVVRGQTGDKASLALCRLVEGDDDDAQEENGGAGSGRCSQHVAWEVLKTGEEMLSAETCNFTVVPGPCVLAWNSVYESSTQAPRVHCWYRGKWHVYLLRTTSGGEDDSSCSISFEGGSTKSEGGFLFRVTSSLSPSSFAWSVLELPPSSSSSSSSSPSSSSGPANDTHVPPFPYPWLPASTLESCSCLCEPLAFNHNDDEDHHHAPPSEIYTATSTEVSFLSSTHQPPEEPVCRILFSSSSSPPTEICALLARTQTQTHDNAAAAAAAGGGGGGGGGENETKNAAVIEHVAVLFNQDPLQRLLLFARVVRSHTITTTNNNKKHDQQHHQHEQPKQELHLLREFQGIANLLRGDFLGSGWDQLALLPPSSSSSSLSSSSSSSMGEVGLTDLVHVWGHKGCCKIEDAPVKLLEDKAGFRSADKARRKAAAAAGAAGAAAVGGGGTTTGKTKKRPLVEQEPPEEGKEGDGVVAASAASAASAAASAVAAAVAEKKERVLGKIREALRERLRDEEAERRRLARVEEQKQVLLRESQGVLTTMAYQEVLPSVPGLVDGGGGGGGGGGMAGPLSFASSLRPVMVTNEEEYHLSSQQQSAPLLPISSHRIVQQEVDVEGQRVALDVMLFLRDMTGRLRLEEVSLAVFSQHGPLTFTSSTIKESSSAFKEKGEEGEEGGGGGGLRLQLSFSLSAAALLEPLTWVGEVTLCCAWRRLTWKEGKEEGEEEEDGETVYPPGAQPLQQLTFSARDFHGASSSNGTSGGDLACSSSSLPLLWKLDAALLSSPSHPPSPFSWSSRLASARLDSTQHTCNLAAIDLPTLCTTLHNLLQQQQHHASSSSSSSSSRCSMVPSALVQPASSFLHGLASTVALLQQELDLLCTLVEGGEPEAATIRDVWLAQPALDLAVYTLANLGLLD